MRSSHPTASAGSTVVAIRGDDVHGAIDVLRDIAKKLESISVNTALIAGELKRRNDLLERLAHIDPEEVVRHLASS